MASSSSRGTLPVHNPEPSQSQTLSSRVAELSDSFHQQSNPSTDFPFPSNQLAVQFFPPLAPTIQIPNADPTFRPITVFRIISNPPSSILQTRDLQLRQIHHQPADRSPSTEIETSTVSSSDSSDDDNSAAFAQPSAVRSFAGPFDSSFMQDNADFMLKHGTFKSGSDLPTQQGIARSIFERDIARIAALRRRLNHPPD